MEDISRPLYGQAPTSDAAARASESGDELHEESPIISSRRNSADRASSGDSTSLLPDVGSRLSEPQNVRLNVARTVSAGPGDDEQQTGRTDGLLVYPKTFLQAPPAIAGLIVVYVPCFFYQLDFFFC